MWGGVQWGAEDRHVFVLDEPLWVAGGDGVAGVLLLKEGGVGDDHAVADAADEGDALVDEFEAGVGAGGGDHAGDVDEFAVAAVGTGGDDDVSAGPQELAAAGEDRGEPVGELSVAAVGEVVRVAVFVVDLVDFAASRAGGADVAVGG